MVRGLWWFVFPYVLLLIGGLIFYSLNNHGDFVLYLNASRTTLLDGIMPWLTHLGDGWFFAFVTLIFLIYRWRVGVVVLGLGLTQLLTSYVLKRLVFTGTPRPKTFFAEEGVSLSFIEGVKVHSYNSFPSGHTMTAFAIFFFLAYFLKRPLPSLIFLVLAVGVGLSRIYLLQHFLIDVCVGSMIGLLLGFAAYRISTRLSS